MVAVLPMPGRRWLPVACLACCLLLSACGQLPFLQRDKPAQVRELIAEHAFYPALDLIDATDRDDPAYGELVQMRKDVLRAVDAYEKQTLNNTSALIKKDQWREAMAGLNEALTHVPASKPLLSRRKSLQATIERRLDALKLELAAHWAASLPQETAILRNMQKYVYDERLDTAVQQHQEEAELARAQLLADAKRLIAREKWQTARKQAALAQRLRADSDSRDLLQQVDRAVYQSKLEALRLAIDNNDMLLAQRLARQVDGDDEAAKALIAKLQQKIDIAVLQLSRDGQQAYTRGELDLAIRHWEKALQLAPENDDIKNQLQRARAFKNNYQRFKMN